MKCKETGEEKTIVFGLTGTGYFDMVAYEKFHNGQMTDYIPLTQNWSQLRPAAQGAGTRLTLVTKTAEDMLSSAIFLCSGGFSA